MMGICSYVWRGRLGFIAVPTYTAPQGSENAFSNSSSTTNKHNKPSRNYKGKNEGMPLFQWFNTPIPRRVATGHAVGSALCSVGSGDGHLPYSAVPKAYEQIVVAEGGLQAVMGVGGLTAICTDMHLWLDGSRLEDCSS